MKKITFLAVWIFISAVIAVIGWITVQWDLAVHPYVRGAADQWRWWNYVTSAHTGTALYLNHFWIWLTFAALFSLFITAVLSVWSVRK